MSWSKFYKGGTKIGTYASEGGVVLITMVAEFAFAILQRSIDDKFLALSREKLLEVGDDIVYESDFVVADIGMLAVESRLTQLYDEGLIGGAGFVLDEVLGDWYGLDDVPTDLIPGSAERLRNVSEWYRYPSYLRLEPVRNDVIVPVDAVEELESRDGLVYKAEVKKPVAVGSSELEVVEVLVGSEIPPRTEAETVVLDGWRPEIGAYLDGCLDWSVPKDTGRRISVQPLVTMPFYVKSWVEQDGELIDGSEKDMPVLWGIKARVNEEQFARWRNGLYDKYIGENGRWLTWQPNGMEVDVKMPVFASFLLNMVPKPSMVRLWVQVTYQNGASEHWEVDNMVTPPTNSVLTFAVGYEQLGLDKFEISNNPVVFYTVWVVNESMVRISRKRRYYLDRKEKYGVRYLIFANSLGGWDSVRCVGVYDNNLKVKGETARKGLDDRYEAGDEEFFVRNKRGELTITLNTGNVDEVWLRYFEEVVWSERVLMATNEGHVAVVMAEGDFRQRGYNEDIGGRTFVFRKSKDVVGYSNLPAGVVEDARPTAWVPVFPYCLIDEVTGKYTGYQGASHLRLFYTDVSPMERVKGVASKVNVDGTEGYVAPTLSDFCTVGGSAFDNELIERLGSKIKNDCVGGYGTAAMITVAAGAFGGTSLADANARAEAEFLRLDTQAYANANGSCVTAPELYTMSGIPSGRWNWRWRLDVSLRNFYVQSFKVTTGEVISNAWFVQGHATSSPNEIYATNSNDLKLLCALPSGFAPYKLGIYGSLGDDGTLAYRVRVWVNGTLVRNITTGSAEVDLFASGYVIPDGARVYVLVGAV